MAWAKRGLLGFSFLVTGISAGCLDRPVAKVEPATTNRFVDQATQGGIDKIDLLFMVDNSASMADKQEILRDAVPVLVKRLTSPICVDPVTRAPTGGTSPCTVGEPEFNAVKDIHVGIVTSSLGAHGGNACPPKAGFTPDDKAHLLGTVRPTGSDPDPKRVFDASRTWNNQGFLAWDTAQIDKPPGTSDPLALQKDFQDMIAASGEQGCGYEAQLESWYRFLIDPEPPANVSKDASAQPQTVRGSTLVKNADGTTTCNGCDLELLAQRKAFLRPDSLVAIVMLTDENDCSIRDDGVGWFVTTASDQNGNRVLMPRATSACDANPNDKCCRSCQSGSAPAAGCGATADDPVCKSTPKWDSGHDSPNQRCFKQKQRFGFDLLYPASRYVDALTKPTLTLQSDGKTEVPNPLYAPDPKLGIRPSDRVFLAGIVGVPWQDVADEESLSGPGLKYLSAEDLIKKDRWAVLLGDPNASPPVPASDPFMRESIEPRSGMNPVTQDPIVAANAMDPQANPINGHEQNIPGLDDLQYACTFQLKTPKTCVAGAQSCDCEPDDKNPLKLSAANSPLCQPVAGGAPTTEQTYAKAYPGTRELEVLKGLTTQGIVASICPKVTELAAGADPASDANYGYNPAVGAIIDRLRGKLQGACLPRAIQTDPITHQVLCTMIEAQASGCGECTAQGRAPADPDIAAAVRRELKDAGHCDGPKQPACSTFCQCEIKQEEGPDLEACRQNHDVPAGFCYVDDPTSTLVAGCPANDKRLLRFVGGSDGSKTPAPGAIAFIACVGAPIGSKADVATGQ